MIIETNKYQTSITKEYLDSYPEEIREQFMDFINNVPFIQNLISPNRPNIKDLPRDINGRAIIDLTNPPIFENADYFRQAALNYLRDGCYTKLKPNSNPNSEYRKFWDKELERLHNGLLREEDGMWVSGYMYWFLNYCPMMVNFYNKGNKKAVRKESFPFFFEGIWWRFLYIDKARNNGHHSAELAKRGAHTYNQKVITPDGVKKWGDIKIGDKLYGTYSNITTVTDIPFDGYAKCYKIILSDEREVYASDDHLWLVHSKDNKDILINTKKLYQHYRKRNVIECIKNKSLDKVYYIAKNQGINNTKDIDKDILSKIKLCNNKNKFSSLFTKYYNSLKKPLLRALLKQLVKLYLVNTKNRYHEVIVNSFIYATKIQEVCWKLGINSKIYHRNKGFYSVYIPSINSNTNPYIIKIKYIGNKQCKCVTVDSKDNCYLIGDYITTHNCAKSYSLSTIMCKNLLLGESEEANKRIITILTAYQKEYLKDDKDGTLSKFIPQLAFVRQNTPFPRLLLKESSNEMTWQMGYKDSNGFIKGSLNSVAAISAKDDSDKLRGKRGWILFEEFGNFPNLLELYDVTRQSVEEGNYTFGLMYLVGCICKGTKVWTNNGRYINIEDLQKSDGIVGFTDELYVENRYLPRGIAKNPITSDFIIGDKECIKITLSNGNSIECSIDHPILIQKETYFREDKIKKARYKEIFKEAKDLKIGDRVLESRKVNVFGEDTLFDPRLVGMLIGDGSYGSCVKYCSEDKELIDYIKSKYQCKVFRSHITKKGNIYEEFRVNGIRNDLNKIGILGQTKTYKRLPINYQTLDEDNTKLLLSGLYDTDGCVTINRKDGYIFITQSNKEILEQIKILWRKFGVIGTITKTNPIIREGRKDKNSWYTLIISGRYNCLNAYEVLQLLVPHKKNKLEEVKNLYLNNLSKKQQKYPNDVIMHKIIKIENLGVQTVYNLTADLSHTYLANNIITHNTANNKESNFQAAKTLIYSPKSYNIQEIKNVYDKKGQGRDFISFFFPAYINRAGHYNEDGISDVVGALLEILQARYDAKYGADPNSVLRAIAENPITPAEAIVKVKDAYFPVQLLTERALEIDKNPNFYDSVYIGNIGINSSGEVTFCISDDVPIRKYPVDNDTKGALEIYNMPEKDSNGKVFSERYIIGVDPYDNDQAESSSLYSIIVFDLFTDQIVAEFTGRTTFANDAHNTVLMLSLFYNASILYEANLKGLFSYFESKHYTYLLADTPEYLRDKQIIKYNNIGNNQKGVKATAAVNNFANRLIRDWLLKPTIIQKINEDNEVVEVSVPTLNTIKGRALLEELIQFNPYLNFDRIRALGMVMLYREDYIVKYGNNLNIKSRERIDTSGLNYDPFFVENYPDTWEDTDNYNFE